jgi:hypothetical protein
VLGVSGLEVRGLREVRELALGWLASVALLKVRGAGAHVGGDGLAAGREQAHHLPADALNLRPWSSSSAPWSTSPPRQQPGPGSLHGSTSTTTTAGTPPVRFPSEMMSPVDYERALAAGEAA